MLSGTVRIGREKRTLESVNGECDRGFTYGEVMLDRCSLPYSDDLCNWRLCHWEIDGGGLVLGSRLGRSAAEGLRLGEMRFLARNAVPGHFLPKFGAGFPASQVYIRAHHPPKPVTPPAVPWRIRGRLTAKL